MKRTAYGCMDVVSQEGLWLGTLHPMRHFLLEAPIAFVAMTKGRWDLAARAWLPVVKSPFHLYVLPLPNALNTSFLTIDTICKCLPSPLRPVLEPLSVIISVKDIATSINGKWESVP